MRDTRKIILTAMHGHAGYTKNNTHDHTKHTKNIRKYMKK